MTTLDELLVKLRDEGARNGGQGAYAWKARELCKEAADALEAAARERADLQETLCFLGKWIERGMFCKTVTASEALSVMAHYPGMPWNSRRWDVDHKPYAAEYYKAFPATAPTSEESSHE